MLSAEIFCLIVMLTPIGALWLGCFATLFSALRREPLEIPAYLGSKRALLLGPGGCSDGRVSLIRELSEGDLSEPDRFDRFAR